MNTGIGRCIGKAGLAVVATLATMSTASAHHPTGGQMPATILDGFLSGIGHPVLGPDHLAFIVALGVAAAMVGGGPALIASFVAASTAGVLIHAAAMNVPLAEQIVALSVMIAGTLIALRNVGHLSMWLPLAAIAGLFHGYAFGEATVGAETGVIGAYVVGIAVVATAIASAVMHFSKFMLSGADEGGAGERATTHIRTAGIILGCVGVVMLAGSLLPAG